MARILIVDDSNLSRRILRSILEPAGHEIIEAGDGMTALECHFLQKPDLTILDLNMREMAGMEVLTQLRRLDPRARVLIGSADIQDSTRRMALAAGAVGFVGKPFTQAAVLNAVDAALSGGDV